MSENDTSQTADKNDNAAKDRADDLTGKETMGGGGGAEKDTADWVTGDQPITASQRSHLDTPAREAGDS